MNSTLYASIAFAVVIVVVPLLVSAYFSGPSVSESDEKPNSF